MVPRAIVTLIASTAVIALGAGCAVQSTGTPASLSAPAASPPSIDTQFGPTWNWRAWYSEPSTSRYQAP
jgi:hypothetical protein